MDELGTRIAWLLRVSRSATDAASADDFAARLAGHGIRVTGAELTALEAGSGEIDAALIRAYESLLGLPTGRLLWPSDAMTRLVLGRALTPVRILPAPEVRRELDRFADVVRHGQPTGADWLSFAQVITQPDGAMLPGFLEDEWLYQLIDEYARAVGETYLSRAEALARIMDEELHAQRLVALIRDRVHEAGAQASVDVLSIWGTGRDAASADAAIVLLLDEDASIRRGATVALLRRLSHDRLASGQLERLAEMLHRLAAENPDGLADDTIALAHRVGPGVGADLEAARGRPATPPEPDDGPTVEVFLTAVAEAVGPAEDPVWSALLRDVFTTIHPERRIRAAMMIAASPYAVGVARTALQLQRDSDPEVARRAGRLLINLARYVDPAELRERLDSPDPAIRAYTLIALAHGDGLPTDLDVLPFLTEPATASSAIYAAGMSQHPVLRTADRNHAVSPQIRRAAQWWSARGGRIDDEVVTA